MYLALTLYAIKNLYIHYTFKGMHSDILTYKLYYMR